MFLWVFYPKSSWNVITLCKNSIKCGIKSIQNELRTTPHHLFPTPNTPVHVSKISWRGVTATKDQGDSVQNIIFACLCWSLFESFVDKCIGVFTHRLNDILHSIWLIPLNKKQTNKYWRTPKYIDNNLLTATCSYPVTVTCSHPVTDVCGTFHWPARLELKPFGAALSSVYLSPLLPGVVSWEVVRSWFELNRTNGHFIKAARHDATRAVPPLTSVLSIWSTPLLTNHWHAA